MAIGDEAMEILDTETGVERLSADVGKMLAIPPDYVKLTLFSETEPHRSRTCNLLIKSQLLYQLS